MPGAGNSQAWNRFSYVLNNPISYVDPSGNMPTNGCNYEGCGRFEGEEYYDYVYNELHNNNERKENSEKVENTVKVLDTVATVFIEPYDWYVTASECIGGYCSPWIALGLLPFIPSSIGTKVDDGIDISRYSNNLASFQDEVKLFDDPLSDFGNKIHGNSLKSTKNTFLYELLDKQGNHLKYGITSKPNPYTRYPKWFMEDKSMDILNHGSRLDMYKFEHFLIMNNPRGILQLNNH